MDNFSSYGKVCIPQAKKHPPKSDFEDFTIKCPEIGIKKDLVYFIFLHLGFNLLYWKHLQFQTSTST